MDTLKNLIVNSMSELDEDSLAMYVRLALDEGIGAPEIAKCIERGMQIIGEKYEAKEYYVAELIMSGVMYNDILSMPEFVLHDPSETGHGGLLLLGTVKDDIHDIGKNIVGSIAKSSGFKVVDLGVDVPVSTFVSKVRELKPDIVGLSGVMEFAQDSMKDTIRALKEEGLRNNLKIACGGATFTNNIIDTSIGADLYSTDAWQTIDICNSWLLGKNK